MVRTGIDLELAELLGAEPVVGQHPLDRPPDDLLRSALEEHFGNAINENEVRMPFRVTGTEGRFNAMIKVEGGGVTGQAGAIRHGIARALLEVDPDGNRLPLRQAGLLTRDPRMKERKKYGLKRARKAPQYTKR